MNGINKLIEMGCGDAIINSCIERGKIHAAVANAATFLKYYKYATKSGLYNKEQAMQGILPYYNELLSVEYLANTYSQLWGERYCKIKLQVENFISNFS